MNKLLLLSVALMLVVLPLVAARDPHPLRGLKKSLVWVIGFNAFFLFILRVVYPRLG
jgi:hypothetical protein